MKVSKDVMYRIVAGVIIFSSSTASAQEVTWNHNSEREISPDQWGTLTFPFATCGGASNLLKTTHCSTSSLLVRQYSITVFAVRPEGLEMVDLEDSNGEKPVRVTVNNGLVYILNSGETNDSLFDDAGNVIDNCTSGDRPTITGFNLDVHGQLTPINGSTRSLSREVISGCAQVSFDPSGSILVVTERLAHPNALRQQTSDFDERLDDEGVINTFAAGGNGRLQRQRVIDATGQGPFGFTFSKDGVLLTAEQFDGGSGRGGAASYLWGVAGSSSGDSRNGASSKRALLRSSPSVSNGGTDICWLVATDDQTLGFSTSFFGNGRISSYEIDGIGIVRLIDDVASGENAINDDVAVGASDLALSRDSQYLYQLNSINGTVSAFRNNMDGTLTLIEMETPFPQPPFGPGSGEAAPVGLAAS